MTDINKLKAIISEKGMKSNYLASRLGISKQSFSQKLNGRSKFNIEEIKELRIILNMKKSECFDIFLA